MPRNNSDQAHIDHRRRQVAALRLRGYTQREIAEGLARAGIRNPRTGAPYDLATVNRDLKALKAEWKQGAQEDLAILRARHHAEILEARRVAWQDRKLYYVFEGLKQEADLLGLKLESQRDLSREADAFLSGVHTLQKMQSEDLSE